MPLVRRHLTFWLVLSLLFVRVTGLDLRLCLAPDSPAPLSTELHFEDAEAPDFDRPCDQRCADIDLDIFDHAVAKVPCQQAAAVFLLCALVLPLFAAARPAVPQPVLDPAPFRPPRLHLRPALRAPPL